MDRIELLLRVQVYQVDTGTLFIIGVYVRVCIFNNNLVMKKVVRQW